MSKGYTVSIHGDVSTTLMVADFVRSPEKLKFFPNDTSDCSKDSDKGNTLVSVILSGMSVTNVVEES